MSPIEARGDAPYSTSCLLSRVAATICITRSRRSFAIGTSRVICWRLSSVSLVSIFSTVGVMFPVYRSTISVSSSMLG